VTAIDWQQIGRDAVRRGDEAYWEQVRKATATHDLELIPKHWDLWSDTFLAARVPQACPTCEGAGEWVYDMERVVCDHCPTVAKLLAIGAAVMTWEPHVVAAGESLLWQTSLRAVEP
jgi:hypothetical protein